VVGLNPTKEKHEILSIFEPVSSFLLCNLKTWLKVNMGPCPYVIFMTPRFSFEGQGDSQKIPHELIFKSFTNAFTGCPSRRM
jgi:hypothetical protein